MARYIDADKLLKTLPDDLPYKASVRRVLMQAPTADVVEVVRCKDCIHKTHSNKRIMCKKDAVKTGMGFYYGLIATEPNNFCSHGERRKDDDL